MQTMVERGQCSMQRRLSQVTAQCNCHGVEIVLKIERSQLCNSPLVRHVAFNGFPRLPGEPAATDRHSGGDSAAAGVAAQIAPFLRGVPPETLNNLRRLLTMGKTLVGCDSASASV